MHHDFYVMSMDERRKVIKFIARDRILNNIHLAT